MSELSGIVAGDVERVATGFQYTEGPLWHPAGYWLFVDTRPNLVFKLVPGTSPEVVRSDSGRANGLTFDIEGRLLMCEGYGRRLSRMEPDGSITTVAERFEGRRLNRPNDVVCRSDGAIFFTDPEPLVPESDRELGGSMVFRVMPDGSISAVVRDAPYPNGLAFSPDERTFYLINTTEPKRIRAYDVDADGALGAVREGPGLTDVAVPDGMAVDTEGRIYTNGPDGVWVFEPGGRRLGTIPVPEPPTNVAFGGPGYGTLLIAAKTSVYSVRLATTGVVPPGARTLMR
ncbi:MAG: SMP-30/gluconolactonase/LRE family protein [Chloroflexi bacterium]|nr:SMP-30/gluconolactonase/LRE family protein [Chloroflexota bacterium]